MIASKLKIAHAPGRLAAAHPARRPPALALRGSFSRIRAIAESTKPESTAQLSWEAATAIFSDESLRDLASLRAQFAAADADGNGLVDAAELRRVLESVDGGRACTLRHWLTEEDVAAVLRAHDLDGDGRLSAAEFEAMASTDGLLLRGSLGEYEQAFDAADADGDGLVGATELADLLRALGRPVTYDELVATMRDFDVDASGKLDFFEVLRMFKKSVLDLDEVLDYVRLTPTKSGAALDAAAHSERRKKAKAAAAAAAAANGASTLEGEAATAAEGESEEAGGSLVTSVYSEEELDDLLASRKGAPTVLMASVTWCRPCRALAKPYLQLAERYAPSARDADDGVLFAKLYGNASDEAKLLFRDKLKVRVTPTFFVFGSAAPGEPTTALHSHTGANKAKLEHAVREAIAARGGDVGGPPLYPAEPKATGGW